MRNKVDTIIESWFNRFGEAGVEKRQLRATQFLFLVTILLILTPAIICGSSIYVKIVCIISIVINIAIAYIYYRIIIVHRKLYGRR